MRAYLEIAELGELFVAALQFAQIGLGLHVDDAVCSDISSLSKPLATLLALVRPLACVSTFVRLGNRVSTSRHPMIPSFGVRNH